MQAGGHGAQLPACTTACPHPSSCLTIRLQVQAYTKVDARLRQLLEPAHGLCEGRQAGGSKGSKGTSAAAPSVQQRAAAQLHLIHIPAAAAAPQLCHRTRSHPTHLQAHGQLALRGCSLRRDGAQRCRHGTEQGEQVASSAGMLQNAQLNQLMSPGRPMYPRG